MGNVQLQKLRFSHKGEHQWKCLLRSRLDTERLGMAIGNELRGGEIITLTGELGAGKTCFVRGLAKGMGLSTEEVTSPTFTIIQEYENQPPIAHVDLYRLEGSIAIDEIGLSAYFDTEHVVVIEWADRLSQAQLPDDRLALHMTFGSRYSRHVMLQAFGTRSQVLLNALVSQEN